MEESYKTFIKNKADKINPNFLLNLEGSKFKILKKNQTQPFSPYTRRNYYKISLTKVIGKLKYGNKNINIEKPSITFFNPLIPYACEIDSGIGNEFVCELCLFSPDFIGSDLPKSIFQDSPFFSTKPIVTLDNISFEEFYQIFQKVHSEFDSDYVYKYDFIRQYLYVLLHQTMKLLPPERNKLYNNAALRISTHFIDLLEKQFPIDSPTRPLELKTAQDYAHRLSVHVNHLNRSVKEVLGKTTTDLITIRIIQEAKSLLQCTDWSIADISYSLGFEYPSYFDNLFKKHTGITPSAIRIKIV